MHTYHCRLGAAPPRPSYAMRPLAFVADPATVGTPHLRGAWLEPTQHRRELRARLAEASLTPRGFIVMDQIGFGPIMLDEDTPLRMLRLAAFRIVLRRRWRR